MRSLLLVFLLTAASAAAQIPAGDEFLVNAYTTGNQTAPALAAARGGSFVVVWDDYQRNALFGQRFDRAGTPLGADFRLNTACCALSPVVAIRPTDDAFLVVWLQITGTPATAIRAQLFDASAGRMGAEFQVSEPGGGLQFGNAVAADENGGFVVAWMRQAAGGQNIMARQVGAAGEPRGSEIRVNSYTTGIPVGASVAADRAGNFVVVWREASPQDPSGGILAQRVDAGGTRQGETFLVNSATTGSQLWGRVAMRPDGAFVVVYASTPGGAMDIFARTFTATGQAIGTDFQVNTYPIAPHTTESFFVAPAVAADAQGNFVVSWGANSSDGDGPGVAARRMRADGTPRGPELVVNTYTTGLQQPGYASLGADESGNFVIAWRGPSPQVREIFARRFGALHPTALEVDGAGNGVWEPGETVAVRPAWLNASAAAQTVSGTLSGLTGPKGPTYSIFDGAAAYPVIGAGSEASCSECYSIGVTAADPRPGLHWDASALETLAPDVHGQIKSWTLHVGGSFGDVPPASVYYPFVETLLHRDVTAGCAARDYCPSASTSREQMSVFVLAAKEGAHYRPPACTTPVFADVPASSPFCRWIEELARRGVTSGCAAGLYCPTAPVSREQMAVFVLRTLDPNLDPPACTTPVFSDVPASSPFCRWIEELVRRGVVSGCAPQRYCPTDPVTREQMAVFLTGTFGLTLYGP